MNQLAFTQSEKRDLGAAGLYATQIEGLQSLLPVCRAWLLPDAPLHSTRAELQAFHRAARGLWNAAGRLKAATSDEVAVTEAKQRLSVALFQLCANDTQAIVVDIPTIEAAAEDAKIAAEESLKDLPHAQRRHRAAGYWPVMRIDMALSEGFAKHCRECFGNSPWPPYMIRPSVSPTSSFRNIVGIVYSVLARSEVQCADDPERSIKNYMRQKRKKSARLRCTSLAPHQGK